MFNRLWLWIEWLMGWEDEWGDDDGDFQQFKP
jgi:hypothetical protein